MSDMISDTANRLFATYAGSIFDAIPVSVEAGAAPFPQPLWQAIEDAGFPFALLSEAEGGFGLDPLEAFSLVRIAAAHAAPVPLAETMLTNWLLASAGMDLAEGPAGFVHGSGLTLCAEGTGWRLTGAAARVAWARDATCLAVLANDPQGQTRLARVASGWQRTHGHNLAAEPRCDLTFDLVLHEECVAVAPVSLDTLAALGAMLRAHALAGAQEAVLQRSVAYANERVQFGRPISKFQAIQQSLAVMATEVAAAMAGAGMAAAAFPLARGNSAAFILAAAAAKLRAGEAAGTVASIAHQVHGAIGFSREYPLHPLTRRLWSWRDEFGNETHWAEAIGTRVATLGPNMFWPFLTDMKGDVP